jgi:DNA-directed RNA polymerase subunit beta
MNVGQVLETHLGWIANKERQFLSSPPFDGAKEKEIAELMKKAETPKESNSWDSFFDSRVSPDFKLLPQGKTVLYDGRTGEPFDNEITVGYIYMLN